MTLEELVRVLGTRGFELVNHQHTPNQVRLLGRVRKQAVDSWLSAVIRLAMANDKMEWTADISKTYFTKGDQLRYAWRLIFQAPSIDAHFRQIAQVVSSAPKPRVTVEEQPLPGKRTDRNTPSIDNRGKGAQGVLRATVGPLAAAALRNS